MRCQLPAAAPPKKAVGRATAAAGRAGGRKAAAEGEGGDVDADADDVADAPDGAAADDIRCGSCHALHPEHNMLLCDGCDASFHTQCLRPPLAAIPSGDWFCGACEVQIQAAVGLPRATAAHCFSLLARLDAGRQLMLHHLDTARLLEGLQTLAQEQVRPGLPLLAREGRVGGGWSVAADCPAASARVSVD